MKCIHLGDQIGYVKVHCTGSSEMRPYHHCALHKRCVPKISGKAAAVWYEKEESKVFTWCHGCGDHSPVN